MKNILYVSFLMFVISASAQTKGDFELGANIGYNSSTVNAEPLAPDTGTGLNVGFSADYYFSDRWSIKGKLIYDQKGWDNDYYSNGFEELYRTNINVNYVTVPVMANWHFGSKRNWYLNFGLYTGFFLNAEETTEKENLDFIFNDTDFGLSFGIGVKIPVSDKLKISLEYDGQSGFTNIIAENSENYTAQNVRGAFNVGVNFILK